MTFGEKLRKYREERGWEREDLEAISKVSAKTIKAYELGYRKKPYPAFKMALASALKVKPSQLDDDKEEEYEKTGNHEAHAR